MENAELITFLLSHDNFLILTHKSPDGDAAGCAAALCRGLRALGKTAHVLQNPGFTPRQEPFLAGLCVSAAPEHATVVAVDLATEGLLPAEFSAFSGKIAAAVDHHPSNTGYAPLSLVEPKAAACGELIYALLRALGAPIDADTASALYLAVSTDTGCFRFSNTTSNTLRVAADLKDLGARAAQINRAFFSEKSRARIELEKRVLSSMEFFADGLVCICRLPREWVLETRATEDDTNNLADLARSVQGVEIAVMLRDAEPGRSKLSVRTGPDYDACAICSHLGGGGHKAAAGASIDGNIPALREAVLRAIAAEGVAL